MFLKHEIHFLGQHILVLFKPRRFKELGSYIVLWLYNCSQRQIKAKM